MYEVYLEARGPICSVPTQPNTLTPLYDHVYYLSTYFARDAWAVH